jgi:hypothetical protein
MWHKALHIAHGNDTEDRKVSRRVAGNGWAPCAQQPQGRRDGPYRSGRQETRRGLGHTLSHEPGMAVLGAAVAGVLPQGRRLSGLDDPCVIPGHP